MKIESMPPLITYWLNSEPSETGIVLLSDSIENLLMGNFWVRAVSGSLPNEKWGSAQFLETNINPEVCYFIKGTWPEFERSISDFAESGISFNIDKYSVGKLAYSRTVYTIRLPEQIKIKMGVTVHDLYGGWSSYPPHKFEVDSMIAPVKPFFYEVFAYLTSPQNGWGIQTALDRTWFIYNKLVSYIPLGSHPVVASPETQLAYIWAYVGGEEKFSNGQRI